MRRLPHFMLLVLLCSCTSESKQPVDPYHHSTDRSVVIAWLEEVPGYVPEEVARRMSAQPYRFQLFGDGTVIYRDDGFRRFQVKLSATELEDLVHELVDTGFMRIDTLMPKDQKTGLVIVDAGTDVIGLEIGGIKKEFRASALRHQVRTFPDNENLQVCLTVCERLRSFQHASARPLD